jgi:hypothetical protein
MSVACTLAFRPLLFPLRFLSKTEMQDRRLNAPPLSDPSPSASATIPPTWAEDRGIGQRREATLAPPKGQGGCGAPSAPRSSHPTWSQCAKS